uniref:Uncharacterized protein n=1 Tax=Lepeophtheirus salmonis TaxID=72036 RepID=A0A0K2USY4_LEPSM
MIDKSYLFNSFIKSEEKIGPYIETEKSGPNPSRKHPLRPNRRNNYVID